MIRSLCGGYMRVVHGRALHAAAPCRHALKGLILRMRQTTVSDLAEASALRRTEARQCGRTGLVRFQREVVKPPFRSFPTHGLPLPVPPSPYLFGPRGEPGRRRGRPGQFVPVPAPQDSGRSCPGPSGLRLGPEPPRELPARSDPGPWPLNGGRRANVLWGCLPLLDETVEHPSAGEV